MGNFEDKAGTQTRIAFNEQEKELFVQGIIDSACKMMERIITSKSAKKRGISRCKPHQQSKTQICRDSIFFNILTKTQQLPARPRDFRINLAEEQKDLEYSELSDILAWSVHNYFLEPKRDRFPFRRGRPNSDEKISGMAKERRGALSYYTHSQIRSIVDEILKDPKSRELIERTILNSEKFRNFAKYNYEAYLYQMKENEQAFRNTMSPAFRKYGLRDKSREELDSLDTYAKDLTPDKIERLAKGWAIKTVNKLQQDEGNILYTVAAVFYIFKVYSSGNLKD